MGQQAAVRWWAVLPAYVIGGLVLGLADPWFGGLFRTLGVKPGLATAASVNLVMPVLAVGLAAIRPRIGTTLGGVVGMVGGFLVGLAAVYGREGWWNPLELARGVSPVLVLASVGYAVIGTLTVLALRAAGRGDTSASAG